MRKMLKGLTAVTLLALAAVLWSNQPAISQWARVTTNLIQAADSTKLIRIDGSTNGVAVGASGTAIVQVNRYTQTLSPAAIVPTATLPTGVLSSSSQTFTVTGLALTDSIFVQGPAQTTNCPILASFPNAANTLTVLFGVLTSATCTPATGVYNIYGFRRVA